MTMRIASASLLVTVLIVTAPAARQDPALAAAFDRLQDRVAGHRSLTRGVRTSLLQKLQNAEASYARGQLCSAANVLGAFLNETQAQRSGALTAAAESLHNGAWVLRRALLAAGRGQRCRGQDSVGEAVATLTASDNQRVTGRITLPMPQLFSVNRGDELWTQVDIAGITDIGEPDGSPGVPVFRRLVAVPRGATPTVRATLVTSDTLRLNLYPFQPSPEFGLSPDDYGPREPPASAFADKPFVKDERAYAVNAFLPQPICTIGRVGNMRDLDVAQLECAAAQYNAATDELRLASAIDFDVTFNGGTGVFVTETSLGPFEPDLDRFADAALNGDIVRQYVGHDAAVRGCLGEELLILTYGIFRPQADALAQWKRDNGIATSVFDVADKGNGPAPDTPEEIDAFIESRYDECLVRPSYVLLFGDADQIPTWYLPTLSGGSKIIATDYPYALHMGEVWGDILVEDLIPEFAVGRIPVRTQPEAQVVVDKIIAYEGNPPVNETFYSTALIASQFQCCRKELDLYPEGTDQRQFIENSEFNRDRIVLEGKTVQRVYTKTVDMGDPDADPPSPPYPPTADTTPRFYSDGVTPLPFLGSGDPFLGDRDDIIAGLNQGRFLAIHRDHGWSLGWANPRFDTDDVDLLMNGSLLPVVFSMNCSSGRFDAETDDDPETWVSFAEKMLSIEGKGAVGLIAASRTTGMANHALARGLVDALWPGTVPYGGAISKRRLGDILVHGKMFMLSVLGQSTKAIEHLKRHHVIGDPTLAMWRDEPVRFVSDFIVDVSPAGFTVYTAAEGATVTALQNTRAGIVPVGRGVVRGGVADIPFFTAPREGAGVQLIASREGAVSMPVPTRALPHAR